DGDSATVAELSALLSAISQLPIDQSWAITGSMNQFGEVQPIGGANEKIEGFFETCRITGTTGSQGVIIPKTNIQNLMLDAEVVNAVRDGQFHIYPVSSVEEAVELLLGKPAGRADRKGDYPRGTVFGAIARRLAKMREHERQEQEAAEKHSTIH
ncbi:S16 family serine protease, partial [uncultured Marinobacter sp.]|uniref:S16 family serine protease n=1 Tax=uncultured Marinobacter sp. TaxID=187379 RepID=UPI0030DC5359